MEDFLYTIMHPTEAPEQLARPELGRFPYKVLSKYPHLAHKEAPIWERFIRTNEDFAQTVDYDVVCGDRASVAAGTPEHTKKDWQYLNCYKIDVVAYGGGVVFVIEVRPRAGLGAIGETLSKAIMWQSEHPGAGEVEPMLITDLERPNVRALCAEHDIGYVVI